MIVIFLTNIRFVLSCVMVSLPSVHAHHNFILDCFRDYVFTASFVPLLFVVLLIIHELSAHCLHNVTSNCWVFFYYCIIFGWHNVKYAKV